MSRASSARRIAAAAVYGGGGLAGLGVAGIGVLLAEAKAARRAIGQPFGSTGPDGSGVYGDGEGEPVELAMLGDSSSVGLGADDPSRTPGAVLAAGLAAITRRPVRLTVVGVVGAESRDLDDQIDRLLSVTPLPHAAVIMVGANDVTHRLRPSESVRCLDLAVRRLRERGTAVVVGTCPDLGTVEPIPQPLRYLARRWSRQLAAAQTVAVVEAGGRTVSLGDLLGPEFVARPREMFSADRFHPSAAGYAKAAGALLPSVCAALDLLPGGVAAQRPDLRAGEGLDDVAHAAARAVAEPGTEVAGAEMAGNVRGPRGRWALLLRRRLPRVPLVNQRSEPPAETAEGEEPSEREPSAGDLRGGQRPVGTVVTHE
ncbi:MAG TPA: SGNH/GDSL hydrolase family protein [Kineosporiaceae bacterium]|nr:SGNH/GDSL hydrolase family protein [Kineosporiaceae bacterium]